MTALKLIEIKPSNLADEHICCAIGNDKANQARAASKKDWMKSRFKEGLVFKRFDARGKFFVEYMPIEMAWKPVRGMQALLIHCLWVSGSYKAQGLGKRLLDEVIKDARKQKKSGVAVISAAKKTPFLTDGKFFKKFGFEVVDEAVPGYELLYLAIDKKADPPQFVPAVRKGQYKHTADFTLVYSRQCPFTDEYVQLMADVIKARKQSVKIIYLKTASDVRKHAGPFASFNLFHKGELIGHELMAEKKLNKLLDQILKA